MMNIPYPDCYLLHKSTARRSAPRSRRTGGPTARRSWRRAAPSTRSPCPRASPRTRPSATTCTSSPGWASQVSAAALCGAASCTTWARLKEMLLQSQLISSFRARSVVAPLVACTARTSLLLTLTSLSLCCSKWACSVCGGHPAHHRQDALPRRRGLRRQPDPQVPGGGPHLPAH
jgi:hypothetical protein